MNDKKFWEIVDEINWPEVDCDDAKFWFMKNYTTDEAEDFLKLYSQKRNELILKSGSDACCDSWDDTLAHIVGLGEEEYKKNITEPERIIQRYRLFKLVKVDS
jgi:hypothetical protein